MHVRWHRSTRVPIHAAAAFPAAVAVIVAACDSRELVGPPARSLAPRQAVSAAVDLGTVLLRPPASSSGTDVSRITDQTLFALPESTWVMVHVTGAIDGSANPGCATLPPNYPCPYGPITTSGFDANYPWDGGPASLHAWGGTWDVLPLRGTGGATLGGAVSAVGLRFQRAAGSLYGRPALIASANNNPSGSPTDVASWLLSGAYQVDVKLLPTPMEITAVPLDDSLGTVRYTVSTVEDLKFINPYSVGWWEPAGMIRWSFVVGDSVSSNPYSGGWTWTLSHCDGMRTCDWAPPRQGRMQVAGYVEARDARARGDYVITPGGFSLTCDATVTRGDSIRCEAKATPKPPKVSSWTFVTGDGADTVRRAGALTDSLTWSGIMATGGTVAVTATVKHQPVTRSAAIQVRSRGWTFERNAQHEYREGTGETCLHATPQINYPHGLNDHRLKPVG
ncbi:MAG TPA: hypothetical protein VFJ82_19480 [Longimicrobium sp.]|nr:hypothetical protein [Longimicrobium sp.]